MGSEMTPFLQELWVQPLEDFRCLYSAVGFYERCGFTANEVKKPYKDTLRMFRTLYAKD